MKRILSIVLALIMCLTVMTSCEMLESLLNPQPEVPTVTDAELAIQTLTTKYYGKNDGVSRDYDLDRAVVGGNTKFAVQWSVDLETIQIVEKDERNVTVDLPADNAEETTYVLTAKIVDADGKEYTKSFTLTLPKYSSDPKADSALTIAEAIALGNKKAHNEYTVGKYYVTGVIKEVYQTKYGNMYLEDAEGNTLTVYGTYNEDGTVQYGDMSVKPVAGDTITVYGIIGKYNTTAQMKNGWITAHTPAGEEVPTYTQVEDLSTLKTGDKVVIGAPAYGKLLSMVKTGNYNVGVDYTPVDGGYANVTDDEIYTVTVNADGTYSFVSASGKALAMGAEYSSMNHEGENKTWNLTAVEGKTGLFYFQNVGRKNYIEWYSKYSNWSSYNPSALDDQYELAIYTVPAGSGSETPVEPAHKCGNVCPACEKCTNADCTEDVCATKCEGHVVTTAEAVALPDGTVVTVTGAVIRIDTAWSDSYGNITVTIGDAAGTLYVYRLATKVEVGQVITVVGKVGSYKDAKQIAAGATATIDEAHTHTFTSTTVDSTCIVAGTTTYTCECGTTIVETLALAAHSANENSVWTTVTAAGCATLGSEKTTCVVCNNAEVTRDIPMTHTKDENGLCTVCNKWTFDSTLDHGEMAQGAKADGETVVFGAFTVHYKAKTKVDGSSKKFDDGFTGTHRLSMGGKTEVKNGVVWGAISFTVTEPTTLKVWWVCGDAGRAIGLYTLGEDGKLVAPETTYGADAVKNGLYITEIEISVAGTYYLGSTIGANNYYKLELDAPAKEDAPVVDTVTYNFATTSTEKGTKLTNETALALFTASGSADVLTSVTVENIYDGNGDGGAHPQASGFIKAGKSKTDGTLTLDFGDKKVVKIEIKCHDWYTKSDSYPTNSNTVSVNGSDEVLAPYNEAGTPDVLTFTVDNASSVTIVANDRVFIFEIVITFAE